MSKKRTNARKRPSYIKIYEATREKIIRGVYKYGTKLPSKRTAADAFSVSTVTVEHAYELLCDEGYAKAKERSGYYVVFSADGEYAPLANSTFVKNHIQSNSLDANAHSPLVGSEETSFPVSVLSKAMRKVINDYGESILERSPNKGISELRCAVADYLERNRDISANAEQIVIGSGSEYLYGLTVEILGRDKLYAAEFPSYNKIAQVYFSAGVECEMLPLGKGGIESAALEKCRADVLHITPYRSFPSGITSSASKRHEYIKWASKSGRLIIEDDYESEFSASKKSEETLFSLSGSDNVIYMNSFSKTVSPSLRVGYAVLPKHLLKDFDEKVGFYSCTVSTFIQLVMAEIISNGDFERHINRVRRRKRKEVSEN